MITFLGEIPYIIAELSKIQVDIRDTETKALLHLFNQETQTEKEQLLTKITELEVPLRETENLCHWTGT